MLSKLRWKKRIFSDLYNIYSNDQLIGNLKNKSFSQNAEGELNGKKYSFKTKGILKQNTEIINSSENKVIGNITYNTWMTKAFISIDDETINWKYNNLWESKWSIYNSEKIRIEYSGSSSKGEIETNSEDPLLLLSGLFVKNYYLTWTAVILIIFLIPLLRTIMN